jgi:hypothetical protein
MPFLRYVGAPIMSPDDIEYALENTKVLVAPERRIETFGSTVFHFHVVTELMDRVHEVRVRDGKLQAERPAIVSPQSYSKLLLEGFGEKARDYADLLERHLGQFAILKYGFLVRKTDVVESIVHDPVEAVVEKIKARMSSHHDGLTAVIQGVDDAWEICLLKFTMSIVQQSFGDNMGDLRRRGLI